MPLWWPETKAGSVNCVISECRYIVGWCRVNNKTWHFNFLWAMAFTKTNHFDWCFLGIICNKACVYIQEECLTARASHVPTTYKTSSRTHRKKDLNISFLQYNLFTAVSCVIYSKPNLFLFVFPILCGSTLVKCHYGIFIELASSTISQRGKGVLNHRAELGQCAKFGQRDKSRQRKRA